METSKIQYLRNLILQYLSCKDPVLRDHMENAIITIFRYNETEKEKIKQRKLEEANDSSSILYSSFNQFGNYFNGFTTG